MWLMRPAKKKTEIVALSAGAIFLPPGVCASSPPAPDRTPQPPRRPSGEEEQDCVFI